MTSVQDQVKAVWVRSALIPTLQQILLTKEIESLAGVKAEKVNGTIDYMGTRISLPADPRKMPIDDAIKTLEFVKSYEEQAVTVKETIERAFVFDAAHALHLAIKEQFGMALQEVKKAESIFERDTPPATLGVQVDHNATVQVPWGRTKLPGIDGYMDVGMDMKEGQVVLTLNATVKRKFEAQIRTLAELTRKLVRERSIYKGKTFRMNFWDDNWDHNPLDYMPKFVDVSTANEKQLVFPRRVENAVRTNMYAPIEEYTRLRQYNIPFKRGVLLAGPFGTGKTLSANVSAKKANDKGITFIIVEKPEDFAKSIAFARQYAPAVVFCEDIDRVMKGERTVSMDQILNTIDGIDSKSTEVMVVLTTNDVEAINQAMIRPGRLDAIIEFEKPDAEAASRLIRMYAGKALDPKATLIDVSNQLSGQIPAVIREVVERSKLAALRRTPEGENVVLSDDALLESAETMEMQLKLLNRTTKKDPNAFEVLGETLGRYVLKSVETLATLENSKVDSYGRKTITHAENNRDWKTVDVPTFPMAEAQAILADAAKDDL